MGIGDTKTCDREGYSKCRALIFPVVQGYLATMGFHNPARNRKSQADATQFPRSCRIDVKESIKYVRPMFNRDSRTFVRNVEPCCVLSSKLHLNGYSTVRWRVLDRVIQQIGDGLAQEQPICADEDVRVTRNLDLLIFLFGKNFNHGMGFLGHIKKRNIGSMKLNMARISAREFKQTFRQPG